MEKPKLTWNDDKKQLTVEIKEKSAKIKKVDLGNLKKYFTKVKKSSNDYKWVYNTTELAKDKKNYTVKVTYENGKTEKSNKVTVKMEDQKPTIKFNKKTKELTVTDKDGIKSAKITAWSSYFEKGEKSKDEKKITYKLKSNKSLSGKTVTVKVKIEDKYKRVETIKKTLKQQVAVAVLKQQVAQNQVAVAVLKQQVAQNQVAVAVLKQQVVQNQVIVSQQ